MNSLHENKERGQEQSILVQPQLILDKQKFVYAIKTQCLSVFLCVCPPSMNKQSKESQQQMKEYKIREHSNITSSGFPKFFTPTPLHHRDHRRP